MVKSKRYESSVASITWDKRGVFILKLKDNNAIFDGIEALKQYRHLMECSKSKAFKLIIDTTGSLLFPTDCAFRIYEKYNKSVNKTAVVANSLPMQLMIGQMVKKLKRGNSMTFKTKEAALEWILREDN